jgi:endonuclease/exonuclease/phosphatase (EEP) superfamily protein YafD
MASDPATTSPAAPAVAAAPTSDTLVLKVGCVVTLLKLTTWVYLLALLALWITAPLIGERNLTVGALLYAPALTFLLPAGPLFLLLLCFRRAWGLAFLIPLAVGWHAFSYMGYSLGDSTLASVPHTDTSLRVLSFNRGQQGREPFDAFALRTEVDVIVLQDAGYRGAYYRKAPNFVDYPHYKETGEFLVLSKFPITKREDFIVMHAPPDVAPNADPTYMAARFEIDFHGQPVAIWAHHARTPREVLRSYRMGNFLYGVLGLLPVPKWRARKAEMEPFWNARLADLTALLALTKEETIPCVLAGDFNASHAGYYHQLITRQFQDTHAEAGHGWGYTFPGTTNNPFAAFRAWLRIDKVFASSHWHVVHSETEVSRHSQHLATMACLELKPKR